MPFLKPDDTVHKVISLPRWQRDWINSHRSINFSGLAQQVLVKIIEERDPAYFEEHRSFSETWCSTRKENIQVVLSSILK